MSAPRQLDARARDRSPSPRWRSRLGLALGCPGVARSAAPAAVAADAPLTVTGLQANGRIDPLGIPGDDPEPELAGRRRRPAAWCRAPTRCGSPAARTRSATADVWDSGKVDSDDAGRRRLRRPRPRRPAPRYVWQVRVWDGAGRRPAGATPASFETGLLDAGDWDGAEWIGSPPGGEVEPVDRLHRRRRLRHRQPGLRRVRPRRATSATRYMWQISTSPTAPAPVPPAQAGQRRLLAARQQADPGITVDAAAHGTHHLSVTVDGSTITTCSTASQIDQRTDATFTKGFVGFRQDFADAGNVDESATSRPSR